MDYDNTDKWVAPEPKPEPMLARLVQRLVRWRADLRGKLNCLMGKHSWVETVQIKTLRMSRMCRRCYKKQRRAGQRWNDA